MVVYAVPDPGTGDQVMATLELDAGLAFDPDALAAFLHEQPDLSTKWLPRFVRVVDAVPLTATGKVDRKPLQAERWETNDPIWWRPPGAATYRRLLQDDVTALHQAFVEAGRVGMLA